MNRMSMMEQVHLGGEDEEDIYGGFNDYNATLDTDVSFQDFSKSSDKVYLGLPHVVFMEMISELS